MHAVLKNAVDRKALMFCSAPDEGKFIEFDYPSGPWRDRFFRIGAAHADGSMFRWTPDDVTYLLPGVDVIKDQQQAGEGGDGNESPPHESGGSDSVITQLVDDFKYETGSSVATALAAGLAALIIYCVKASILAAKMANQSRPVVGAVIPDNGASLIADPDAMKRAFASLGHVTPDRFIRVWEELDKASEILGAARTGDGSNISSPEARLRCIERFNAEFGLKLWSAVKW